jgi:hypothetical protein
MSQKNDILLHLMKGQPIDPMLALCKFGCFRLGARIFDLKKEGWPIQSKLVGKEKKYAEYRLPPPTTT